MVKIKNEYVCVEKITPHCYSILYQHQCFSLLQVFTERTSVWWSYCRFVPTFQLGVFK